MPSLSQRDAATGLPLPAPLPSPPPSTPPLLPSQPPRPKAKSSNSSTLSSASSDPQPKTPWVQNPIPLQQPLSPPSPPPPTSSSSSSPPDPATRQFISLNPLKKPTETETDPNSTFSTPELYKRVNRLCNQIKGNDSEETIRPTLLSILATVFTQDAEDFPPELPSLGIKAAVSLKRLPPILGCTEFEATLMTQTVQALYSQAKSTQRECDLCHKSNHL